MASRHETRPIYSLNVKGVRADLDDDDSNCILSMGKDASDSLFHTDSIQRNPTLPFTSLTFRGGSFCDLLKTLIYYLGL